MKTFFRLLMMVLITGSSSSFAQNLYNADGALTDNRIVTMISKNLTFLPSNSTSQFFINGTSGFIGLGTASPLTRFHIASGDARIDGGKLTIGTPFTTWDESLMNWGIKSSRGIILQQTAAGPSASFSIYYQNASVDMSVSKCVGCFSQNAQVKDAVLRGSSTGSFIISNENTGNIKFETRSSTTSPSQIQMLIDKDGNVGIGTGNNALNPDEKLAVNGLIHTKEVKVDLIGWPDYVFYEDYALTSLEDVEKYIQEFGHLKGIPSSKQVALEGVLLGDMNKKLLEKIEELTLYMIELKKEVDRLKENQNPR